MAGEPQVPKPELEAAQKAVVEIRRKLTKPKQPLVSWQAVLDELLTRAPSEYAVSQETIRKLGDLGIGGTKVVRLVTAYTAPSQVERVVEKEERYPVFTVEFARARAAGVDDRVIDAARATLGVYKSLEGPTEQQVRDAIRNEQRLTKKLSAEYFEAASDLDDTTKDGAAKKKARR